MNSNMTSDTVDLLLIGKTGSGKSASGNSILRKRGAFVESSSLTSVTSHVERDFTVFESRVLKVVDGPGVGDTRGSDEEALKLVLESLEYAIMANPSGYHAFLIVLRYGERFTEQDAQVIRVLKHVFGEDFVKRFCILLLTCGDNFAFDEEESGVGFEQWCREARGVFQELLQECSRRVVLFDNKTKNEEKRSLQVAKLMSLLDTLEGVRYTDKHFLDAKQLREKIIAESKEKRVRDETLKVMVILLQEFERVHKLGLEEQKVPLHQLKSQADDLKRSVEEQDSGTGALKYALNTAASIVATITNQLEKCEQITMARTQARAQEEEMRMEFESSLSMERESRRKQAEEERRKLAMASQQQRQEMDRKFREDREATRTRYEENLAALQKELEAMSIEDRGRLTEEFKQKEQQRREEDERRRAQKMDELDKKLAAEREEGERRRDEWQKEWEEKSKKQWEEQLRQFKETIDNDIRAKEEALGKQVALRQEQSEGFYKETRKEEENGVMKVFREVGMFACNVAKVCGTAYSLFRGFKF